MLEFYGKPSSVITFSTDFSFQNLVSWNLFEFSVRKSFTIQELLHRKSKPHETKPMHLSSSRALQRHQEHDLKHPSPGSLNLIATKQTTFLHR
jgi:hypothetical protein